MHTYMLDTYYLREGHWVVPDDEEVGGPGQGDTLTAGQALRQQGLLHELEERKAVKNQRLQEKRELQDEIRGSGLPPGEGGCGRDSS
ncbi:uncharacterized protein Aud_010036 [Aspergillus udagawae]|uniref:Uncharacterized protein n=1 Tax=Aspergillus udagawae TaxID=91492 RepID=A0A8E0R2Z3_9EURO|nr:uncharacterized protein Aud_010036 [Aspergillus udagawae]GIC93548.1 hypothetical protein Aud_010036 [Aspergillus udagawae]